MKATERNPEFVQDAIEVSSTLCQRQLNCVFTFPVSYPVSAIGRCRVLLKGIGSPAKGLLFFNSGREHFKAKGLT